MADRPPREAGPAETRGGAAMQTVICLKWEDRYSPDYVNRLHAMVRRNTRRPLRFVCITDDPAGIDPRVEIRPMPPFDLPEVMRRHPFRRMFLFAERLHDLEGDVLHLDLDVLVTGSIDRFFDHAPEAAFALPENWTQRGAGIGNMSMFRFRVGALTTVWERFRADPMGMMRLYRNSQTFVCRTVDEVTFFPEGWCVSFKHTLMPRWPLNLFLPPRPPRTAAVVAFTGKPDIHEAARGEWPVSARWKKLYKVVRPTPWILEYWRVEAPREAQPPETLSREEAADA